jgi:hypothetical protein
LDIQSRLLREHAELLLASTQRISQISSGLTQTASDGANAARKNLVQ